MLCDGTTSRRQCAGNGQPAPVMLGGLHMLKPDLGESLLVLLPWAYALARGSSIAGLEGMPGFGP